jgi:Flp pilus assembly protein TadD
MACGLLTSQDKPAPKPVQQAPAPQKEQEPPEEDENLTGAKKDYAFNPLQSAKEVQIGSFYYKKGSYRAAAQRFREATRWNPGDGEAWLHLAETCEKLKDSKGAREAYEKYLEVSPDARNAPQIRKKLKK